MQHEPPANSAGGFCFGRGNILSETLAELLPGCDDGPHKKFVRAVILLRHAASVQIIEESRMSVWQCFHLNDTLTAMAISDRNRFLVSLREPMGADRHVIEFYRWTLRDAMKAADRLVQAYYPHNCSECGCGRWRKL